MGSMAASAVTPKVQSSSRVRSRLMPGEGHGGVQRQRNGAGGPDGMQDPDAETAGGVGHELSGLPGAELRQALHERAEGVVGDGQEHQFGALDDVLHVQHRDTGEQGFRAFPAGVRDRGDPDDGVLRAAQRRPQDGADFAGADDSDAEASWFSHAAGHPVCWVLRCSRVRRRGSGLSARCRSRFGAWGSALRASAGHLVQPVLAGLPFPRGPGPGRLGVQQRPPLVQAGLDQPRGHRPGRGVQDQVRHAEAPRQGALLQRHGLGALVRDHHEVPPPAARADQQGRVGGGEAVAAPAQRCQQPGAARRGDKAAVVRPDRRRLAGDPAGPARPLMPAVKIPTGSGVPGSGRTRESMVSTSGKVPTGRSVVRDEPLAVASRGAVAGHVDLDPVPAEDPPQRRLADPQRLDPARRQGLRLRVQQAVPQPDAVRGNGGGEVVAPVEWSSSSAATMPSTAGIRKR